MKTIPLTIPNYAKQLKPKKSRIAVYKAVKRWEEGKQKRQILSSVVKFTKLGRDYILEVSI